MKYILVMFPIMLLLMTPTSARGQLWSGIIDPSRAINWSTAGIPGGIPNRTTICTTLNSGATAAQINSALAACPREQVVFLSAGTYNLSSGIDFAGKSNVTLRGAGPDQTLLVFNGNVNCWGQTADICIRNADQSWTGGPAHSTTWTGGYAKGTTQITLGSTAGLAVGSILILDQDNDTVDTGGVYVCDTNTACATDTSSSSSSPGRNLNGVDRNQQQFVQVTAINGNTVTTSPGLYMPNWRASQNPGAWWANTQATLDGVENLAMDHTNGGQKAGLFFLNAYECWVTNVKSLNANRDHVWLYQAARTVVRDSYFYGTQNSSSLSYGVESFMSSDNLVENNIFQHVTAPILMGNSSGTVVSYNFTTNDYYTVGSWQMPGIDAHDAGTGMNLFEGNEGAGFLEDNIHGSHNFATVFRNQFTGLEPGKTQQTNPLILMTHSRYANLVGNILGTAGYHTVYEDSLTSGNTASPDKSIYLLGWSGVEGQTISSMPDDALVASTLLRWGNYDVVTRAARWNSSEIPAGNAIPTTQSLPSSFYLSSKPSWWGTMPWPAIGPDVAGGPDPSGHAYPIPAQLCYINSPTDSNGILIFNAARCYLQSRPAPPTNLTVVGIASRGYTQPMVNRRRSKRSRNVG
ncbi:MAG TPA: right-handed parallel beta-helix repeat-containing protein [Terriglobales bacterium]|nr:right-handed parallel beta-helix repeat-containing protein [Terriglobales bacterium]